MRRAFLPYAFGAALALSAFSGWQGYRLGKSVCEAAHAADLRETQEDLNSGADQVAESSQQILEQAEQQRRKAEEHEHEAYSDRDPCRVPSDDSLRRLQRRWGAAD